MVKGDFILPRQNRRHRLRKLRRYFVITLSALLLLVVGILAVSPVRNGIRSWQAKRHAGHALALIDQKKWTEARDEASAAYHLRPNQPEALRAVARLLSRAGQAGALEFWKTLDSVAQLTSADLREEAGVALKVNDLAAASEAVRRLLESHREKPTPADFLLAADLWARKREYVKATRFAEKTLIDPSATRREQLQSTLILETVIRSGSRGLVTNSKQIDDALSSIAAGNDDVALDALSTLAQYALAPATDSKTSPPVPIDELIRKIDNHPLATVSHKLVAADLEISQKPSQRAQIEQREIDRWKDSNDENLSVLAAWLFQHGEYQRLLDTIPLQRAVLARELFLQHVNALGALGRWDDIRKILESERYPLDPVIQHMYLAHCQAQQGQQLGADNNWQRAIEEAAGDLTRLLLLGDYAEKNGALKVAMTAYEAASAVSSKSRAAQLGRLRVAYASGETAKLHSILEALLKIWPNDNSLKNDEVYTRLLLLPADTKPGLSQLKAIEAIAQGLLEEEPSSLPHRTVLGLVFLKENRPYTALNLYAGLNVPQKDLTPSSVVVHSAVLAATGHDVEARTEAEHVPQTKMLPEERELIKDLLPKHAGSKSPGAETLSRN